ncbi:PaaI family thioesterase [Halospina sp. K52047b]|uniref:PaaI family thioesterase n=1 Tax=Halospina sp. K52047b TaxID=2614160 RepID=UPI001CE470C8|nr:PaaI family thioesterase [Halospina sp. K52047b]
MSAEEVQQLIRDGVPMAEDIDFRVEIIEYHAATARVPFSERMVRPGGTLSGPVQMALADATMYAAVLGALGEVQMAVTSNLNINFLRKPGRCDLIARGQVLKLGSRNAFCEVQLFSEGSDELVAHVSGTYSLP